MKFDHVVKGYGINITFDQKDNVYVAQIRYLPSSTAHGKTRDKAFRKACAAISYHIMAGEPWIARYPFLGKLITPVRIHRCGTILLGMSLHENYERTLWQRVGHRLHHYRLVIRIYIFRLFSK